MINKVNL